MSGRVSSVLWALVAGGVAAGVTAIFLGPSAAGLQMLALGAACLSGAGLAAVLVARPAAGLVACLAALAATVALPGGPAALWKDAFASLSAAREGHVGGAAALVVIVGTLSGSLAGAASRRGRGLLALVPPLAAVLLWWSLGGRGTAAAVWVLLPAWWLIVRPGATALEESDSVTGPATGSGRAGSGAATGRAAGADTRRAAGAGLALVLAPTLAMAAFLPTAYAPPTADRLDAWARAHIPLVAAIEGGRDAGSRGFGTRAAGFISAQVEALGGPFLPDSRAVMIVTARAPEPGPRVLYLRGAVRDVYDGHSWALAQDRQPAEVRPGPGTFGVTVSVDVRDLATGERVLFAPEYLVSSSLSPAMDTVFAPGPVRTALGPDAQGPKEYRETAFVPYPWPGAGPGFPRSATPRTATDAVPPYQGAPGPILERDLALPDSLPQRVVDLARSLTRGRQGTVAKARALEAYLQQFTYDTNPPATPARDDFVDHFLFTSRRGYCTSFASALVVMLRAVGVPARYVEGYRVPLAAGEATQEGQQVVVRRSQAHAWVEAFDPSGPAWITFDPTPAGPLDRSSGLDVAGGTGGGTGNGGTPANNAPDQLTFRPGVPPLPSEPAPSEAGPIPGDAGGGASGPVTGGVARRWLDTARRDPSLAGMELALAAFLAASLAAAVRLAWLRARWLRAANPAPAAWGWGTGGRLRAPGWPDVARLAWAGLEAAGMRAEPGQTALRFLRQAGDRYPEAAGPLARLASAYDAVRYGPAPEAGRGDGEAAMETWRTLRRTLGRYAGRLRIWLIEAEAARRARGRG